MRLLVLGASGMAGHVICMYFREQGHHVDTVASRHQLDAKTKLIDATNKTEVLEVLTAAEYDVVLDCVGILVKESEQHNDKAILLNSYLPKLLEDQYKNTGTKVIHISTDAVFSGEENEYFEDSFCDGKTFYGRSKALGEINNTKDLTIRTSIIGPEINSAGTSLFNWFYKQKDEIKGYENIFWRGVTTIELAKFIDFAITQNLNGICHFIPNVDISKYNLLKVLGRSFKKGCLSIKPATGAGNNARLTNSRQDFAYTIPTYEEMVMTMLSWVQNHKDIYPHYLKSSEDKTS